MRDTVVFGQHDAATLEQMAEVRREAAHTVLCADGHKGYVMPVGGVAAYYDAVSVMGVGVDIACGNAAIRTSARVEDLDARALDALATAIERTISFGVARTNHEDDAPTDHPLFADPAWSLLPAAADAAALRELARSQLGTVGGGNHYVDVFADETGQVWVGVHFGSRGFGFKVARGFLALGQGRTWGAKTPEVETMLDLHTPLGDAYWGLMNLIGTYAYAGREWVARKVVQLLGAQELELVHNHHNFAWQETHQGDSLVVVRKGATPAFPGQRGFVGGSMGDDAVILEGVDSPHSVEALYSTVHGAGRVMSRTQARGKLKGWGTRARLVSPGVVSQDMLDAWVREKGVVVRGGGVDESPHCYRRLPDVLTAHEGTVRVVHTLRPLIVVMAPADQYDPFKD